MSLSFPAYILRLKHPSVKLHIRKTHNKLEYRTLSITVWHLWQQKDKNSCNARVRVRAREGRIGVFTIQNLGLWIVFRAVASLHQNVHRKQHVVLMKTTRRFDENNTSLWRKQHVTLKKTTRRFDKNNTSFWWKQHVTLKKTTRRFDENNTSFWRKQAGVLYKSPHWWKQRKNPADTTCINISIKRIIQAQKPRSCAKSERREVEKQRKGNEDIAKQKRHLSPICLKKAYYSNQIDVFNPLKDQKVKTNW